MLATVCCAGMINGINVSAFDVAIILYSMQGDVSTQESQDNNKDSTKTVVNFYYVTEEIKRALCK